MSRIINHNDLPFGTILINDEYWDLHLYDGGYCGRSDAGNCIVVDIDAGNENCFLDNGEIASSVVYENAVNNGISLENIGRTGIDNGMVVFDKDVIDSDGFVEKYTMSEYSVSSYDSRFRMHKVGGNNKKLKYGNSVVDGSDGKSFRLDGGWYQGFYKVSDGCDYNVLPKDMMDDSTFEFVIKPECYDSSDFSSSDFTINDLHPENAGTFFYIGTRAENKWTRYYDDEFSEAETDESDLQLDGGIYSQPNIVEIETNNKFAFFNNTDNGFTTETWDSDVDVVLSDVMETFDDNQFLMFNNTDKGLTAEKISEGNGYTTKNYTVVDDLTENAFSLFADSQGCVGYRYLVRDCDAEHGYSVLSEKSKPGNIKQGKWNNVRMVAMDNNGKLRIRIYVEGKLVLLSMELPKMNLRTLNDIGEKQEGVAFNISFGGGTQGLADVMYSDWKDAYENDLPLERSFGGSFEGKVRSFRIYGCSVPFGG